MKALTLRHGLVLLAFALLGWEFAGRSSASDGR